MFDHLWFHRSMQEKMGNGTGPQSARQLPGLVVDAHLVRRYLPLCFLTQTFQQCTRWLPAGVLLLQGAVDADIAIFG